MEKEQKIFTPPVINWLIAIFLAVVLPFFSQDYIATAISSFGSLPELEGVTNQYSTVVSATIMLAVLLVYTIGSAYQIRYIALLKTHSCVWAFIVTFTGPIIVWFLLPLYLGV